MTIVANTYLTFSAIGQREDLSDTIYNISPTDTPFTGNIAKTKATAVNHEWQTDALAAAAANAQLQGDDVAFAAAVPTSRLGNRTQISRKEAIVAGTLDAVNKAGRQKEIVYQLLKKSKELKRDREFVLCSNQAPVTGNSTTAPQLRPLVGWYATNVSRGAGGGNGTTSAAATDGTQRALTEAMVKTVIQSVFTNGGDADMIMADPTQKVNISAFTGGGTKFDRMEDKTLTAAIDVYVSDFGTHKIVPNRFQRSRDVHILSTDLWALAELRPMFTQDLAQTGDAAKAMIITEYTLEARNEAGSGVVADLS